MRYLILLFFAGIFAISCNNSADPDLQLPTRSDTLDSARQNKPSSATTDAIMFDGHDVRVTGNEPFWMVELTKDSVVFTLVENQEYRQLIPVPTVNTRDSVRYLVHTVDDVLDILITNQPCTDNMSGFKKRFTGHVHIKRKTSEIDYHGCGDYLSEYSRGMENRD